jgi:capsular exopolysaccharide synthesis family protein
VYWPYFLLLTVLAVSLAWVYLHFTTPLYEATARILIKDETKGAEEAKGMDFLNMTNTTKLIENETEVISSKPLIYSVVKDLGLYAEIFEEGRFNKSLPAYSTCPLTIAVADPDAITETDKTYFYYNKVTQTVTINGKTYPINTWITLDGNKMIFKLNPHYNGSQGNRYFYQISAPSNMGWAIKDNMEVTPTSKQSTILQLVLKDEDPKRAEDILNGLMAAYNKATVYNKNTLASNTLFFLEQRLKRVQQELDSAEKQIQQYKESTGSINIGAEGELFLKNVSDNDQKISEINMQLAVLDQVEDYVMQKNNKAGIVPSTLGVNDPILSNLLNLLYNTELEYEKLKNTEAANSVPLITVRDQIAKIRPGILENIESQRKTLGARKANLYATNDNYSSAMRTIPEKEKKLVDIDRQRNIISGIYTFLLQKREDLSLSNSATLPSAIIVDHAEASYYPVSPKPKKTYLLAFAIPVILGIGTITIREAINSKVLFRSEIESMTACPVIGEIVHNKTLTPIVTGRAERTFISEQFRQLRVSLTVNKDKPKPRRILVTSTIAGEGKSFIALNLALTFALTGKRVALMEMDINNPNICNKLEINRVPGIADFLQGECDLQSIIRPYSDPGNLFVIPAGAYPQDHFTELLENGKIQDLINYLSANFDYVILDTAPVGSITDAYILSAGCDITLYVVRHKYTPKVFVQRLDQNDQLMNVAVVFNDIRSRGFGKYKFGYGYGYGYVYGKNDNKHDSSRIPV